MAGSIHVASFKRRTETHQLELADGLTSQWLDAAAMRSVFCIAVNSVLAIWDIEAQLPNGTIVQVANYGSGALFDPTKPRYITVNAMCGLPIRFVSSVSQSGSELWVVIKS